MQPTAQLDKSLLTLIGNTPLVRLNKMPARLGISDAVEIYGKAEWMNPGGSVKDRPALNIIETAEADGTLTKNKILLDATSGNTGIAYSMICAVKGYQVKLCLPEGASRERKRILQAYGADLVFTPASESSDGAIRKAQALFRETSDLYFYADQYGNPANPQAHYETTGVEIFEQTKGRVTHFVAGIGTSGTFVGTTRRLKSYNEKITCISVQPDLAVHGLEGMKHLESAIVPKIYDSALPDATLEVSTETAYQVVKDLARHEGLLLGISAAANVSAALRVAKTLSECGESGIIVTILCDNGMKYLSEKFWDVA
jgi:cysteine synthase B